MIGFWRRGGCFVTVPRHEISHDGPLPRRPSLIRSQMRFRTNVEDVGNFFSKSLKEVSDDAIDDALGFRRDYAGHREAAEEMYHQVYGVAYAHNLQPRRERGWGPSLVVSDLHRPLPYDTKMTYAVPVRSRSNPYSRTTASNPTQTTKLLF